MDAIEAIHSRRSVRAYLDRPVEREVIEALIWDAAQAPPPAIRDLKRWAFVVVEGRSPLVEMGALAKAFARAALPAGPVPAWLDNSDDAVGVPDGFKAVAPIVVGYPATTPAPRENPRPDIVWPAN